MDSPNKGAVTWRLFPCDDVTVVVHIKNQLTTDIWVLIQIKCVASNVIIYCRGQLENRGLTTSDKTVRFLNKNTIFCRRDNDEIMCIGIRYHCTVHRFYCQDALERDKSEHLFKLPSINRAIKIQQWEEQHWKHIKLRRSSYRKQSSLGCFFVYVAYQISSALNHPVLVVHTI